METERKRNKRKRKRDVTGDKETAVKFLTVPGNSMRQHPLLEATWSSAHQTAGWNKNS
jgi:hypothetical protein